jgi:beta-mannosidase
MAKQFYAPLLVSGVENSAKGTVEIYVNSDLLEPVNGELSWTVTDVQGNTISKGKEKTEIKRGSRRVNVLSMGKDIKQYGVRNLMVWLELAVKGKAVSTDFVTFARPKHLELCNPDIRTEISQADGNIVVTLTAKSPALWTWLELTGADARFSDNFFHLRPDKPVKITVTTQDPLAPAQIKKILRVRNLFDTYK